MLTREAIDLLEAAYEVQSLLLLEAPKKKKRKYYYDIVGVKRWILGDGGNSGNCEICEDNEALGWIDQDAVFDSVFGSIDEPPAHPHCTCTAEFTEKRKRVYV
jgi:hypothetical protein